MFFNRRKDRRRRKKADGTYSFWDAVGDVLIWIPELIILPFRLLWFLIRGIGSFFNWT
ncbi:MAG: hypothetical protein ACQEUT_16415 [Bacillota bacterium]